MLELLTNSRMKTARSCQRRHYYQYELGYRARMKHEAPRLGNLTHAGLEGWFRGSGANRLVSALEAIAQARTEESDSFELRRAEMLVVGYDSRWAGANFEILAVEKEFVVPLINPVTGRVSRTWLLAGKIDAIVRDQFGRTLIVEHKTSGEDITAGSDYWKRLRLDGQISTYYEGARSLGYDVQGCLYDVVGKPHIKPLKETPLENRKYTKDGRLYAGQREVDETPNEFAGRLSDEICANPDRYYQRAEVVRLDDEMREAELDAWDQAKQIRAARLNGIAPRNPDSCIQYGRACDYFGVCTGTDSLDDQTIFVKLNNVHSELSERITQPKEEATYGNSSHATAAE